MCNLMHNPMPITRAAFKTDSQKSTIENVLMHKKQHLISKVNWSKVD